MDIRESKGVEARNLDTEREQMSSQFIVTPNCSMSWRANKLFVTSLALVSFGIGGVFALQGLWVILPFVGFEIAFLALVMYWSCLRATQREVISINADNIQIEVGRQNAQQSHRLQSAWTSVYLHPPGATNARGKLLIRSKGEEIEVGACLSEGDRKSLATSINQTLAKLARTNLI